MQNLDLNSWNALQQVLDKSLRLPGQLGTTFVGQISSKVSGCFGGAAVERRMSSALPSCTTTMAL